MGDSSRRPRPAGGAGPVRATVVLVLFLALVVAGVATWRYDLLDGRLDGLLGSHPPSAPADTDDDPVALAPPPGLDLPVVVAPGPAAPVASTKGRLDADAVRTALLPYLGDPDLGRHVRAVVAPLGDGRAVFTYGAGVAIPASTTKLVTSSAALLALGPEHVFSTETWVAPTAGTRARLTLVGGGDPFLERAATTPEGEAWPYPARADLTTLAASTAVALEERGVRRVRLAYDDSLFSGPAVNPRWEPGYIPSEVAPTSALWVDAARTLLRTTRVADPAREAADAFAAALASLGIAIVGEPSAGSAGPGSEQLAQVDSAPLARIVQRLLDVSDNDAAEVLLRHVGLADSGSGSTSAGRRGVRRLLADAGVRLTGSVLYDGSGLSRADRADPRLLVDVLRLAADPVRPDLAAVVEGLPVAGFTGSLSTRMDAGPPAGLGRVRAKTGTLTSVTSLAGIGTDLEGTLFAFALMADRFAPVDAVDARQALDSAAAALGACRCSG